MDGAKGLSKMGEGKLWSMVNAGAKVGVGEWAEPGRGEEAEAALEGRRGYQLTLCWRRSSSHSTIDAVTNSDGDLGRETARCSC
jgi:hypothetical protein